MITRRDLVKWGAVAPAVAVTPGVTWARMPQGVDALVVDRRLGAAVPSFDARQVYQIDGDVTALWYDVLDTRWRRPGFVLAGLTGRDTLFVLETLAADRGRRVVSRQPLERTGAADRQALAWIIAPVHPSVRL